MLQTQLLSTIKYLKLCHISTDLKSKINRFCKFYCKNLNIKVPLTPFKVADIFNVKDPVPKSEKAFVVHKFVSPGCNACNSGETTRHLSTKIKQHLETDKRSCIFAHIVNNETCKTLGTENCFDIIDSTSNPYRLKLKETIHIILQKQSLKSHQKYVSISISVKWSFIFNYYFIFSLPFLFLPLVYYFIFERLTQLLDVFKVQFVTILISYFYQNL